MTCPQCDRSLREDAARCECGWQPAHRRFVGRRNEMAELSAGLAAAAAGAGRLHLITGDPGLGKTRLAEEVSALARERGFTVLWGRAWEGRGAPSYWPWIEALRGLVAVAPPGASAQALARMLPELGGNAAASVGGEDADQARFALFDAVGAWLRGAAAQRPILLVLDDLHAADEDSLLLLQFVARAVGTMHVLALVTSREAELRASPSLAAAFAKLGREAVRLPLQGLSHEETAALVRHKLGQAATPELHDAISRLTEGNPFFIDEVVRQLAAGERGDVASLQVPASVRDTLRRNLLDLRADAVAILEASAVLGVSFDSGVAAEMLALPESDVTRLLGEAVTAGVLARATPPATHRFHHALLREALLEGLSAKTASSLHAAAARALVRRGSEAHLAEIAYHFLASGDSAHAATAAEYALRAADAADRALAFDEAVRLCRSAADVLDRSGRDGEPCVLASIRLGEAEHRAGAVDAARAAFDRAAARARELGRHDLAARAAIGYARTRVESGDPNTDVLTRLDEALRHLPPDDDALRASVLSRRALSLYFVDTARAAAASDEALACARRSGDRGVLATVLSERRFALWTPERLDERRAVAQEAAALADELGRTEAALHARMWLIVDLLETGEVAAVDRELSAYSRAADRAGAGVYAWHVAMLRAARGLMEGRFADAAELSARALEAPAGHHFANARQFHLIQSFFVARDTVGLAAFEEPLRTFSELYAAVPAWRCGRALLYGDLGRLEEARREIDVLAADGFAGIPRDGNWLPALAEIAEAVAAVGDRPRASLLRRMLEPFAASYVVLGNGAVFLGSVASYLSRLAAVEQDWEACERWFAEGIERDRRTGAAPLVARAGYHHARTLLSRGSSGDAERARELLAGVLATTRALGMAPLAAQVHELLDRASPEATHETTERIFRREGEFWTVGSPQRPVRIQHLRGMDYIARLLASPGREFHVIDLAASASPATSGEAGGNDSEEGGRLSADLGDAGEMLDERARRAYESRLRELDVELAKLQADNDLGRLATVRAEIEMLTEQLSLAVGLGGRSRRAASHAERARVAVTKAVKTALQRVAEHDSSLAHHLSHCIHTGMFCGYEPDPRHPERWLL